MSKQEKPRTTASLREPLAKLQLANPLASRSLRGDSRLSSSAEAGDLVLDGAALVAVGAVVVARQDVRVDVAQADPVVAVLVARVDAALVAADAGVDDVLRGAVGGEGSASEGRGAGEEERGTHGVEVERGVLKMYMYVKTQLKMMAAQSE